MSSPAPLGPIPVRLLALAGMVLVLQFRPIHDVDVFLQVRLGGMTLDRGWPTTTEPFAAKHLGEPLVPLAWLGQAVFAAVHRLGGWAGLQTFDALVWAGGLIAATCARPRVSIFAVLGAVGLAFLVALPYASLRPQSFAVLAFGLVVAGSAKGRIRWLLPGVLVLWQNLHPSVSVAAIGAGGAFIAGLIAAKMRGRAVPWGELGLAIAAGVAVVCTPAGFGVVGAAAKNAEICRALEVAEWLPAWDPANHRTAIPGLGALLLTLWLARRNAHRVAAEDVGRALALGVMTLFAYRFAVFWAVAMIPVWMALLSDDTIEHSPTRTARLFGLTALAVALVLPVAVGRRLFAEYVPVVGIERLARVDVHGPIYCHPKLGGPLIGLGRPDWTVTLDGRYYVYTTSEWADYPSVVRVKPDSPTSKRGTARGLLPETGRGTGPDRRTLQERADATSRRPGASSRTAKPVILVSAHHGRLR